MKIHSEKMEEYKIVEKILVFMSSKFDYILSVIEESNNFKVLAIDDFKGSLLVMLKIWNLSRRKTKSW